MSKLDSYRAACSVLRQFDDFVSGPLRKSLEGKGYNERLTVQVVITAHAHESSASSYPTEKKHDGLNVAAQEAVRRFIDDIVRDHRAALVAHIASVHKDALAELAAFLNESIPQ